MLRGLLLCAALAGCGSTTAKRVGEPCSSSAECEKGLLCDLGQKPAVCADKGSLDAAVIMIDGRAMPVDARPIDAPPDAPPD